MSWKELKKRLEKEKTSASDGSLSPFWDPQKKKVLAGKIIGVRPSNFKDENSLYTVEDLDENQVYTVPEHQVLSSALLNKQAKVGDFVLIEFTGLEKSKSSGRDVFMYEISVVKEEDAGDLKPAPLDAEYEKIKGIFDFYDGEISVEEFVDICGTKGIKDPMSREYVHDKDGMISLDLL